LIRDGAAFITAQDGMCYARLGTAQDPLTRRYDDSALPEVITSAPADIARLASYTVRSIPEPL